MDSVLNNEDSYQYMGLLFNYNGIFVKVVRNWYTKLKKIYMPFTEKIIIWTFQ